MRIFVEISIETAIQRIRVYAFGVRGWTKKEVARRAKVSENSLRHIHEKNWDVSLRTLRKLERVIPADWQFAEQPKLFSTQTKEKHHENGN